MAFSISLNHLHFAFAVLYIFVSFCCQFDKAENLYAPPNTAAAAGVLANEYVPGANQGYPQTGGGVNANPDHVMEQALLCFNQKQICSSCNEAYRLSQSGDLNVPQDYTDQYCSGPCVSETSLVLNCIESLFWNFKFYNGATISDVKTTIRSGCSYGPTRGDFNVAGHIQDEYSNAYKTESNVFLSGLVFAILARHLLL